MSEDDLRAIFLAASAGVPADAPDLDEGLRARTEAGRSAWPELAIEPAAFVRYLGVCADPAPPSLTHAADLWLACACALGAKGAASVFERTHRSTIERAVVRVCPAAKDEVTQAVMVSLLVSEPGVAPRISEYRGRAALRTWLSTVAANAALNQVQRRANQAHDSLGDLGAAVVGVEPELALAKARHGVDLEAALRDAAAALDRRQRVLLRLHHGRGWTLDRLARMYRISRSAAGRLVIEARAALLDDTKRRLREGLKLTPSELESLLAVLRSDLDVSLARALEDADDEGAEYDENDPNA